MARAPQRRFQGLTLHKRDSLSLKAIEATRPTPRVMLRIVALRMLSQGTRVVDVAQALDTYPRVIRRVAWGYIDGGVEAALYDADRAKMPPELSPSDKQAIVAMCCGPAPEGRSSWTVRLIALEAVARGLVPKVGRESVRRILLAHDLKPWREKNVVRPTDR